MVEIIYEIYPWKFFMNSILMILLETYLGNSCTCDDINLVILGCSLVPSDHLSDYRLEAMFNE